MPKYILAGVDGHLGSVAASYALDLAQPGDEFIFTSPKPGFIPRSLLQSWLARGAKILMVSYDDPANLVRAFTGADAVAFISSPNNMAGRRRRAQHGNVVRACRDAGVPRIVYTSLVGADAGADNDDDDDDDDNHVPVLARDHAYTERLIRDSGLHWNIQRDYLYFDNVAEVFAPCWKACGDRWVCNSAGAKAAFVAREDCGRVLGALLMGKGEVNSVYTVTGPEAVSNREIFEWVAKETGYAGRFEEVDDGELEDFWREKGLPQSPVYEGGFESKIPGKMGLENLEDYGRLVKLGFLSQETDAVVRLTGRRPLTFADSLGRNMGFPGAEAFFGKSN